MLPSGWHGYGLVSTTAFHGLLVPGRASVGLGLGSTALAGDTALDTSPPAASFGSGCAGRGLAMDPWSTQPGRAAAASRPPAGCGF